jgi:hypothetical protein
MFQKDVLHISIYFLTYIACDYEMHVMLMLMLWDANVCLTPRGVTVESCFCLFGDGVSVGAK